MSKTTELKPCPVCEDCGASLPPSINEEYTAEEWHTRAEVYITHPITGEPMDKSQCKRVITQMADQIKYLKEQLGIVHRGAKTLTQMSIVEGTHEKT